MDSIRLTSALHIFLFFWLTVSLRCATALYRSNLTLPNAFPMCCADSIYCPLFLSFLSRFLQFKRCLRGAQNACKVFGLLKRYNLQKNQSSTTVHLDYLELSQNTS